MAVSTWTDPVTQSDGNLIDQAIWNNQLVENIKRVLELTETKELINNSGGTLNAGDVVIFDSTSDNSVTTTTTAGVAGVAGVIGATTILAAAKDRISTFGYIGAINVQGNVTRGNYLETSTTAGRAKDAGAAKKASTFAIALTGYAGGGAGQVAGYVAPSSQSGDLPSNGVAHTTDSSAPNGYTEYTTGRGRYIVGVPASGTLEGTVGTALTNTEDRAVGQHNHAVTDSGHDHDIQVFQTATGSGNTPEGTAQPLQGTDTTSIQSATTGITIDNAGSVAGTNAPYVQLLGIIKD